MIKAYIPQSPCGGLYFCFVSCSAEASKAEVSRHYRVSWSTLKRKGYKLLHLTPKAKSDIVNHVQQLNRDQKIKAANKQPIQ
jgi:hypothetical protein